MSYTLRSTSLFGSHLDTELTKRGARTSGTTSRKQERLQRFRDAEALAKSRETLRVVAKKDDRKFYERVQQDRAIYSPYNTRSKRGIISIIQEYLY